MSRAQRIVFAVLAVIVLVVALAIVGLGGGDEKSETKPVASGKTSVQTTQSATATAVAPKPPLLKAGSVKTLTYKKGDTVTFRAVNPTAEEVHVHGYDKAYDLEPGKERTISFKATLDGQFEIELEGSATQLATLRVEP